MNKSLKKYFLVMLFIGFISSSTAVGTVNCGNGAPSISLSNIPEDIVVDKYGGDLNTGEDIYINPFDINNRASTVYFDIHLLKDKHGVCTTEDVPFWGNDKENGVVDPHKFYEIDRNQLWASSAYIENYQGKAWKSDKGEAPVPGTYKVIAKYTKNPSVEDKLNTIKHWKTASLGKVRVKAKGASEVKTGYHYCRRGNPQESDLISIFDVQRPLLTDLEGEQLNVGEYIRVNGYKIDGAMGKTYMYLIPKGNHPCNMEDFNLVDYYIDGQERPVDWTGGWEADVDSDTQASEAGEYKVILRYSAGDVDEGEVLGTWKTWYLGDVTIEEENNPPEADLKADKNSVGIGTPVNFDASSSSDDKGLKSYRWDFDGDNSYDDGRGKNIEKIFQEEGVRNIGLKVTDTSGATDTAKKTVEVFKVPEGAIQASKSSVPLGREAIFQYSVKEGSYRLDIKKEDETVKSKDVEASGEENSYVSYLPEESGSFEAELVAEAEWWQILSSEEILDTASMNVKEAFTDVSIKSRSGSGFYSFRTDAESKNTVSRIQWDLDGDGEYEKEGRHVERSYLTTGRREIRLKVTDERGNTETATKTIEVGDTGVISVINRCSLNRNGDEIEVETSLTESSDIEASINISWRTDGDYISSKTSELGDAVEASTDVDDFEAGEYSVNAVAELDGRVLDTGGCGAFNIEAMPDFNPAISLDPSDPEIDETIDISASPEKDYSYKWDTNGDGEYSRDGINIIEQYSTAGEKVVRLRVLTEGEIIGEASRSFDVQQPDVSSSLTLSKEEVVSNERLRIGYSVGEAVVENGFHVVVENPSGDKVLDRKKAVREGSLFFTPADDSEKGTYSVKLVAEEGFLQSIVRNIFGPEEEKTFEVLEASENLDRWQEHCKEHEYDYNSASGRVSCIEEEIGPECFQKNPEEDCIEIADSVCDYYRGTDFNPDEGRCN